MDDFEKVQIDALLSGTRELTGDNLELGRQVHAKARRILEPLPLTEATQIIWGSDDDRIVRIKRKRVIYTSQAGTQELALTNFHKNKMDQAVAIEIPDENGYYSPVDPEYLFAVKPSGEIDSPLALVTPELAGAMLELFEEVPKVDSVKAA